MNRIVLAKVDIDALLAGRTVIASNDGPNLAAEQIEIVSVEGERERRVVEERSRMIRQSELHVIKAAHALHSGIPEKQRFELLWDLAYTKLRDLEDYRPWRDL